MNLRLTCYTSPPKKRSAGIIPRLNDHHGEMTDKLIAMPAMPVPITSMMAVAIMTVLIVPSAEVECYARRTWAIVTTSATNPITVALVAMSPIWGAAAAAVVAMHRLNLTLSFDRSGRKRCGVCAYGRKADESSSGQSCSAQPIHRSSFDRSDVLSSERSVSRWVPNGGRSETS